MKKNRNLLVYIAVLLLITVAGCAKQPSGGSTAPSSSSTTSSSGNAGASEGSNLELTLEQLAAYNGKDGNPGYIAVDGVIYDVSGSSKWKDGEHNGYAAGKDLTEFISKSPHGASVLSKMTVVGKLVQ